MMVKPENKSTAIRNTLLDEGQMCQEGVNLQVLRNYYVSFPYLDQLE